MKNVIVKAAKDLKNMFSFKRTIEYKENSLDPDTVIVDKKELEDCAEKLVPAGVMTATAIVCGMVGAVVSCIVFSGSKE